MGIELITTGDGSHSLFNRELDETYHSVHGAIRETAHVFINNGLDHFFQSGAAQASVLEVGFGTGLNALMALNYSIQNDRVVRYHTLEAFPVEAEMVAKLNYGDQLEMKDGADWLVKLHSLPWEVEHAVTMRFLFRKQRMMLEEFEPQAASTDVIFFDAFAPSKQPRLWEFDILEKMVTSLRSGGSFVTYCAKGQLKRDLKMLGLTVETLPGPPGKKEMVRAMKP